MAAIAAAMVLASCGKDIGDKPCSVRVIYSESGLGDGSYVDGIYRGVCVSEKKHACLEMENYCPETTEYAEAAIADWMNAASTEYSSRMLILADADYASILARHPEWKIPDGGCVLVLDYRRSSPSQLPGILTRKICSYGASYMAGMVSRMLGSGKAAVISANPGHEAVREFCTGFADGWKAEGGTFDENADIHYLGNGPSEGFDRADDLYRLSFELDKSYDFVFPVCGGSIQGVFRYTREYPSSFFTCGMDADMQAYSDHVLFNVIKRMDLLVEDTIDEWISGKALDEEAVYGLGSGYISLEYSDIFSGRFPEYTERQSGAALNAGLEAEKRYLGR